MKEADIQLHNRLIAVLDYLGCDKNTSKFAKGLGINSQNISNIYNRKTIPKLNLIAKIASHYPDKINYHWLLTGTGKMLKRVIKIDESPETLDLIEDSIKVYQKEIEDNKNAYLLTLQAKDQNIIALQEELNETKQKTIELLERYLEEK